jgi:hypothetical protein
MSELNANRPRDNQLIFNVMRGYVRVRRSSCHRRTTPMPEMGDAGSIA